MSRIRIFVAALVILSAPALAGAQGFITQHPGAACSPTHSVPDESYQYSRGQLLNTGTRPIQFLLASCPLWEPSRIDNYRPVELRAVLMDSQQRTSFCTLSDVTGRPVGSPRRVVFHDGLGEASFSLPDEPSIAGVEYTIECIVHAGARMSYFGTLWNQ
jgi:hypothetical protein